MREEERPFVERVIAEARRCQAEDDRVHPKVGAAVIRHGKLVAAAYRGERGAGEHAEFTVLERKLPSDVLVDTTVIATLEPCTTRNHPKVSCARRLVERGIKRVVIGMVDPDPRITGQGIRVRRSVRIEVGFFPDDLAARVEEL